MSSPASILAIALACATVVVAQDPSSQDLPRPHRLSPTEQLLAAANGRGWLAEPRRAADPRLHLLAGVHDPLRRALFPVGPLTAPTATRLHLVQFAGPIVPKHLACLAVPGVEVLFHVPAQAMLVRADAAVVRRLAADPLVRWAGPLANGCKLAPELHRFVRTMGHSRALHLAFAHKRDARALAERIATVGGQVTGQAEGATFLRAELDGAQLLAVLAGDEVVFVDPAAEVGFDMDHARLVGGANHVETLGNLSGQGVRIEITEPLEETHPELVGRVLVRGGNFVENHGHCTAGIVGADGSGDPAARGMLPAATLIEGNYTNFGALQHFAQATGSTDPSQPWQAMVATASWGSTTNANYTTATQAFDDALFAADLPRTQSMGNLGNSTQVRPEAWGKNGISVGGVFHHDDASPANDAWNGSTNVPPASPASIGPAVDGRWKPDLVAFFDAVRTLDRTGAVGYTNTDYYWAFSGTSAATPIVAGHVGLALQMFTDGLFGNPLPEAPLPQNRFVNRPHMATAKALVCNTAEQYAFSGTSHDLTRTHQGWGFPSVQRLYDHRGHILVCDQYDRLQANELRRYWIYVAPGTPELRVTMNYPDPAALPLTTVHRVNDLDLRVTRWSDGLVWWGNHGLLAGTASTAGGAPDDRNTLESVYLANPVAGLYEVEVSAAQVVLDGDVATPALDVPFALVAHPLGGGNVVAAPLQLAATTGPGGQVTLALNGVPAGGFDEGFTLVSRDTGRGRGLGSLLGVEIDSFGAELLGSSIAAGNAFHFDATPGVFPFTPYVYGDAAAAAAAAGTEVDAVVVLFGGGAMVAVSNVVRFTLQ